MSAEARLRQLAPPPQRAAAMNTRRSCRGRQSRVSSRLSGCHRQRRRRCRSRLVPRTRHARS
eukprot:664318-Pleurochrysis_carterae.AAC.1